MVVLQGGVDFTGPEPDRQVDLLERKHPYFLPCPFTII